MDIIISAATHRSGSTLLQRIFNARKKTLIWGEHKGCITNFCNVYDKVNYISSIGRKSRESYFKSGEDPNQWLAIMAPTSKYIENAVVESTRNFLDTLYEQNQENHDMIGFKEVRYGKRELTLLRKCYPNAKIVLLIRNPIDSWKSYPESWGDYRSLTHFAKKWNSNVSFYLEFAKHDPNVYLVQFEKLVKKDPNTLNMIAKAGKLSHEEILHVLSEKISGVKKKKVITKKQRAIFKKYCGRNFRRLGYM